MTTAEGKSRDACEFCGKPASQFKSRQAFNGHRSICKRTHTSGGADKGSSPTPPQSTPLEGATPPIHVKPEKAEFTVAETKPLKLEPIPELGGETAPQQPQMADVDLSKIFQVLADKYNESLTAEPGQATIDKFKLTQADVQGMGAAIQALDAKYGFMKGAGQYVPEILAAGVFIPICIKIFMGLRYKRTQHLAANPTPYNENPGKPAVGDLSEREAREVYEQYWGSGR